MAEDYIYDEDQYDEDGGPPVPLFWRILGKCIKYTAIALIVFINAFLLWRVFFSTGEPSAMKTLEGNAALADAYEKFLAGESKHEYFAVYQAGKDNIGTDEKWHEQFESASGVLEENFFAQFFLTDVVFFPDAGQMQTVLRYNKSCLEHLAEDYKLEKVPSKSAEVFDVTLVVSYRPDEASAVKSVRLKANLTESETSSLYSFRQFSFEEMPAFDSITEMQIEINYKEAADHADIPYSVIDIYDKALGTRPYELDNKDISAIKGAK